MVYDWPYWEAVADEVLAAATACSADAEDSGGPSEAAVPRDIGRADVQETLETWRGGHGGGFPGAKAQRECGSGGGCAPGGAGSPAVTKG